MSAFAGPNLIENGLVGFWDAGNTRSYPGSGTTWTDLGGRNNTGTLTNGPTFSSSNGGYIAFDGTNDYVDCGSNYSGLFSSGFTWGAWIQIPTGAAFRRILTINTTDNTNYQNFLQTSTTRTVQAGFSFTTPGPVSLYKEGTTALNVDTWYYVTATMSSSVNIYVNGVNDSGTTSGTPSLSNSYGRLEIGRLIQSSVAYYGQSFISNAHLYNRELSQSEISQNFNALRGRFGI